MILVFNKNDFSSHAVLILDKDYLYGIEIPLKGARVVDTPGYPKNKLNNKYGKTYSFDIKMLHIL